MAFEWNSSLKNENSVYILFILSFPVEYNRCLAECFIITSLYGHIRCNFIFIKDLKLNSDRISIFLG